MEKENTIDKRIHIVLFEPEIPQNTGNIMRTCVAANLTLHLIEPLGFILDHRNLKRSGLDYREDLKLIVHDDLDSFFETVNGTCYYVTRYAEIPHSGFDYTVAQGDIYLIFGKESTGLPLDLLSNNLKSTMRIPMIATARSLNLSNCVAIVGYEVLRQLNYPNLSEHEVLKGKDWLTNH